MGASSRPLLFALNGRRVELASPDPAMTLLTYIRSHTRFTGTKLSCGEGGCGACLVLLSKYDAKSRQVEEFSINSCLTLLCSIDGCSITTIEGLGSTQNGFHAVQERIAGFHGSQCGFCTPGMCMSIYSCLRNSRSRAPSTVNGHRDGDIDGEHHHDPLHTIHTTKGHCDGDIDDEQDRHPLHTIPTLSLEDAQKAIVGNICRCTGYRPIVDACKSFAGQVDVEDLGINTFWASNKEANINRLPSYLKAADPVFPDFLIRELNFREQSANMGDAQVNVDAPRPAAALNISYVDRSSNGEERSWIQASTLEAVFEALQVYQGRSDVKLVVGNTSAGYYKDQSPRVFIDISQVPELLTLQDTASSLKVGAAITIEKLIHTLEAKSIITKADDSVVHGLVSHLKKVANTHVRHRASIGGNLIMAQQFSFDSDIATLFLAVGVTLKLVGSNRKLSISSMEAFLQKGPLEPGMILESVSIPLWLPEKNDECKANGILTEAPHDKKNDSTIKRRFKSYRAAPRHLGNSLAFINAAFLVDISSPSQTNACCSILDVRLAFGAFGQAHAIRAHTVESFLIGKTMDSSILLEAIEMLKQELGSPLKGTKKSSYKSSVAVGFVFDFFCPLLPHTPMQLVSNVSITSFHQDKEKVLKGKSKENGVAICAPKTWTNANHHEIYKSSFHISGKQSVPDFEEDYSIGKPVEKSEAKIQAAGEAVYVDDVPSPDHCLFAAFVLSAKAFAKVKFVDPKLALASPGAVAFISSDDIPRGGANIGPVTPCGTENLFATDVVEYVGHPLGVMVADSPQHAKDAAAKVRVEYDMESSPVLCVEDAVAKNSFFTISPFCTKALVGDIDKGFSEADQKIMDAEVKTGSQYYFYMETQTALAIPDEDDCMVVYSSCQSPSGLQKCVSTCLGIPNHNVRVITRRVGGGFGGKAFRNVTVASACAVAAHKLRHPVRMYLDRKTDMIMMGGRHPTKTLYSVGFKSDGKVTGLQAKIFIDGGWSVDLSPVMPLFIAGGLKKYNWGSMDIDFKACKTNLSSKSAFRGPGHVQGSFIADTVLEHVAAVLGLDVHTVITRNMHTLDSAKLFYPLANMGGTEGYTLPSIWNMMLKRMEAKEKDIVSFNGVNKWLKRGLSILPCVYNVHQHPIPARVSIFHDGSVVVEVGGIELGQGLWTKVKQATVYGLSKLRTTNNAASESLKVRVVQADSISLPHGGLTSDSTTSEGSCEAIRQACQVLIDRLMPLKRKKEQESSGCFSWRDLITLAEREEVDLSAQVHWYPEKSTNSYLNYGVAATEVELNVLTGAVTILQADVIYDCGKSLNPAVDIGQIEGSFVQGIGFFLTEEHEVDSSGELVSNGTWTYKPPTVDNIPQKFCVEMIHGAARQNRILSSKACGEPPLLLAGSVHSAVRRAIEAAREDRFKSLAAGAGGTEDKGRYFRLDTPASMDRVKNLCGLERVEEYLKYQKSGIQ